VKAGFGSVVGKSASPSSTPGSAFLCCSFRTTVEPAGTANRTSRVQRGKRTGFWHTVQFSRCERRPEGRDSKEWGRATHHGKHARLRRQPPRTATTIGHRQSNSPARTVVRSTCHMRAGNRPGLEECVDARRPPNARRTLTLSSPASAQLAPMGREPDLGRARPDLWGSLVCRRGPGLEHRQPAEPAARAHPRESDRVHARAVPAGGRRRRCPPADVVRGDRSVGGTTSARSVRRRRERARDTGAAAGLRELVRAPGHHAHRPGAGTGHAGRLG
jgi:hypothetical protein